MKNYKAEDGRSAVDILTEVLWTPDMNAQGNFIGLDDDTMIERAAVVEKIKDLEADADIEVLLSTDWVLIKQLAKRHRSNPASPAENLKHVRVLKQFRDELEKC